MPEIPAITLPGREDFVALARNGVQLALADAPADARADAALITVEFMTNAVLWSKSGRGGSVTIQIEYEPGSHTARIEVTDDGKLPDADLAAAKEARVKADEEQYERGLLIVAGLAKDWGQRTEGGHGTYWAVLAWN